MNPIEQLMRESRANDVGNRGPNFAKYVDGHRQLRVLTKLPSAKDHRPLFHYDTLSDEEQYDSPPPPYRVLRWHPVNGTEVCATSPEELAGYEKQGYVSFPPNQHPVTALDAIAAELAALSPEDRALVLEAQRKARIEALVQKTAQLSDADLASLSAAAPKSGKKSA
jgi:hypothetical protein